MITADNIRTAHHILVLVGLGKFPESKAAAGIIAVRLASLPPEPEKWGTPEASSEEHVREAVLDACRTIKAVGWVPDVMTVAILATAHVGNTYGLFWLKVGAALTHDHYEVGVRARRDGQTGGGASLDEPKADTGGSSVAQMFPDGGSDEPVTDPAWEEAIGEICAEVEAVTAAAQVEDFPTATESRALARTLVDVILDSHGLETGPDGVVRKVDTTVPDEAVTATPIVGHVVDVVSVEDPDFSPTGAADATPAPKKPRCGKVYGQKESMPPIPMVCTRPEGHKGGCGEAKIVGKAKAAEVGS